VAGNRFESLLPNALKLSNTHAYRFVKGSIEVLVRMILSHNSRSALSCGKYRGSSAVGETMISRRTELGCWPRCWPERPFRQVRPISLRILVLKAAHLARTRGLWETAGSSRRERGRSAMYPRWLRQCWPCPHRNSNGLSGLERYLQYDHPDSDHRHRAELQSLVTGVRGTREFPQHHVWRCNTLQWKRSGHRRLRAV